MTRSTVRGRWPLARVALMLVLVPAAFTTVAGGEPSPAPTPTTLEDVDKVLGPFTLGGERYSVVLHGKRIVGPRSPAGDEQALATLDIRDGAGTIVHHETFAYTLEDGSFMDWCSASARLERGAMISVLLIESGCLPSAPGDGATWEIFGVWDGKFARLGAPFTTQGEMLRFTRGAVAKLGTATSFGTDAVELRVWTGNFRVTVPLTLNWVLGRLMPPRCYEQSGSGMREGGCDLVVEVQRLPVDEDLTFVRLFDEPTESMGIPRHVVVKRDSRVEFLGAHARVVVEEGAVLQIGVGDDPWLHVRIDGREGWLHTQEDFAALGVPQAG